MSSIGSFTEGRILRTHLEVDENFNFVWDDMYNGIEVEVSHNVAAEAELAAVMAGFYSTDRSDPVLANITIEVIVENFEPVLRTFRSKTPNLKPKKTVNWRKEGF